MSNFFLVACRRWANVGPPVKKPLGQRRQPSSGRRMCRRWPNVSMLSGYTWTPSHLDFTLLIHTIFSAFVLYVSDIPVDSPAGHHSIVSGLALWGSTKECELTFFCSKLDCQLKGYIPNFFLLEYIHLNHQSKAIIANCY